MTAPDIPKPSPRFAQALTKGLYAVVSIVDPGVPEGVVEVRTGRQVKA